MARRKIDKKVRPNFMLYSSEKRQVMNWKRNSITKGYNVTLSLWGEFTTKNLDQLKKIRIDVMCNGLITPRQFNMIESLFSDYPTLSFFSIFTFDVETDELDFIGGVK